MSKEKVKLRGDKESLLLEVHNGEVVYQSDKKNYKYLFNISYAKLYKS